MAGRLLARAERRGKYMWLAAGNGEALLAHLGMSGQMVVGDPDRPLSPHVRVRFTFADGGPDLRFTDQRTFGHLMIVQLIPGGDPLPTPGKGWKTPLCLPSPGELAQTASRSTPWASRLSGWGPPPTT